MRNIVHFYQSTSKISKLTLHEKPYFIFRNVPRRSSFQKKLYWNMILLVLSKKTVFIFPEMILFFRRKMKDDLSQKNTWKHYIFFKCSKKTVFPKNRSGIWSSLYYLEIWYFFPKMWYFFLDGKWKMIFAKKYLQIWYFLYICINGTNMTLPVCPKNQRWFSPKKGF